MTFVMLDLEWNGAPLYKTGGYFNEIIEFGAVKFDESFNTLSTFRNFVRPKIHKKLTGRVKQLTHISNDEIKVADDFASTFTEFELWMREDLSGSEEICLMSWGTGDLLVLIENMQQHKMKKHAPCVNYYCDAQAICQKQLNIDISKQPGLSMVAEQLGIECGNINMHRALNDSFVSVECLKKLWDKELFDKLLERFDDEFIKKLTFKKVIISDIDNPLVDRSRFRQNCPNCGKQLKYAPKIISKNRSFIINYECPSCGGKFVGRHQFQLRYEGIKHRCTLKELTTSVPEGEENESTENE